MFKKYPFYLDPIKHKKKVEKVAKAKGISGSEIIRNLIDKNL